MRLWLLLILTMISLPATALAERVAVPTAAQARLDAGDYQQALALIEPVFDQCMAAPAPGDSCLDIMIFMLRTADASGNAQSYDAFLDLTLRYGVLVLSPADPQLAELRTRKGDRLFATRDYAAAETLYRQVLVARRAGAPVDEVALETALADLELVLSARGGGAEAAALAAERVAIAERSGDSARLGRALERAGRVAYRRGRYAEAETWLRRVAALDAPTGPDRARRMDVLHALALALVDQRKLAEAREIFVQTLALIGSADDAGSWSAAELIGEIALMDRELGRIDDAEAGVQRALALLDAQPDGSVRTRVRLLSIRSTLLARRGLGVEALRIMQQPVDWLMTASEADQADLSDVLQNYAVALVGVGRAAAAEPIARRVLAIRKATLRADDPLIARALDTIGYILGRLDRHAEALEFHVEAAQLLLGKGKEDAALARDDLLIVAVGNIASTLSALNRLAEAEPFQAQALDLSRRLFSAGSGDLATALNRWAQYRKALGQCDGLDASREARTIWARQAGGVSRDRVIGDINLAGYLRMCRGAPAEQRSFWLDATRYVIADMAQSRDYDARAAEVLRERRVAFLGVIDSAWQLAHPND